MTNKKIMEAMRKLNEGYIMIVSKDDMNGTDTIFEEIFYVEEEDKFFNNILIDGCWEQYEKGIKYVLANITDDFYSDRD